MRLFVNPPYGAEGVGHSTPLFLVSCNHASFGDSSTTSLCFLYGKLLESSLIRAPNPGCDGQASSVRVGQYEESNFDPSGDNLGAPADSAR